MALIPITNGAAIGNAIKACLEADPCKTILCDCCCEEEPDGLCDDCPVGYQYSTYGDVGISGGYTISDIGQDFSYYDNDACDCRWVWERTSPNTEYLILWHYGSSWCAYFSTGGVSPIEYTTGTDCPCESDYDAGVVSTDLVCTDGLLIGSFDLPRVGGGTSITVTFSVPS